MNKHWVAAWGVAPSHAERTPAQYARDITLRYTLHFGVGGSAIRLHFSNYSGQEDVRLSRVCVRLGQQSFDMPFAGQAVIPAGGVLQSEALALEVKPGDEVAVSLYLKDLTPMHSGCVSIGQHCHGAFAQGDRCGEESFSMLWAKDLPTYYFLTQADLLADESTHAWVAYGDSITAQSWPDHLMDRLAAAGRTDLAIVRRGISGSRVLREYDQLQYLGYGPEGMKRFEREVIIPGAKAVLIMHGINDILHPEEGHPCRPMSQLPAPEDIINGLRQYIRIARENGLRVYMATLTAIRGWRTDAPFRQEIRSAVNEWIRTTDEIDGCVDFDAATHDPADPLALLPECDSGDHLHPSVEGARRMAMCIPEEYLL